MIAAQNAMIDSGSEVQSVEQYFHRGLSRYQRGAYAEALPYYLGAHELAPGWFEPLYHAAACLHQLRRYREAIGLYQQALQRDATQALLWYHYAKALKDNGQLVEALPAYRQALALGQDNPEIHYSYGLLNLLKGNWLEGWVGYEQRWQGSDRANCEHRPATLLPGWQGESVPTRSGIIVYAEQGMGDTLQCFRYVKNLRERFQRVRFSVQAPLVGLLQQSAPAGVEIVARVKSSIDETGFTHHAALMSLPALFRTTPASVPNIPRLRPDEGRMAFWNARYGTDVRPRIGIVWQGGKLSYAPARDLSFNCLVPLLENTHITWVSLQKDTRQPAGSPMLGWMQEVEDFADTAALIATLDLVIAADTAVAHLAGTMGKPVWLLNRYESEWRWMHGKSTTPWYPTMRIFNQVSPGDWNGVIEQVRMALANHVFSGRLARHQPMKTFLHVGCDTKRKDRTTVGFNSTEWNELRLDINPEVAPDITASMLDMAVVADSSMDAIFSSHNLEHLYPHEVPVALKEFRRVLRRDGFAVITCPDLQSVCEWVTDDKPAEIVYDSPAGPVAPIDILYGYRLALAAGNQFMAHRGGFTRSTLTDNLTSAGFETIAVRRRPFPCLDLWALASCERMSEGKIRDLMTIHFPATETVEKLLPIVALGLKKTGGVTEARVDYPLSELAKRPNVRATWGAGGVTVPEHGMPGVFILHRQFMNTPLLRQQAEVLAVRGWVLVADMDDDPHHWDKFIETDFYAYRGVHAVTVSTEPLAEMIRHWNPNVQVFPNAIFQLPHVAGTTPKQDDKLRIFFGALNRGKDWEAIQTGILAAAEELGNTVQFVMLHDRAIFDSLPETVSKEFHPTLPHDQYMAVLASCDVALLPLADTPFNRFKSDLKFIECCAAGVVPICSSVVYGERPAHHDIGVFAETADEWRQAVELLCGDTAEIRRRQSLGFEYVKHERMHRHQVAEREAYYRGLLENREKLEAQRQQRLAASSIVTEHSLEDEKPMRPLEPNPMTTTAPSPAQQLESLTIDQALHQAVAYHQAGQLQDAERLYRTILQAQSNHPDANHNLGVLAVQVKQTAAGLPHFKAALEANPNQGQYWLSYIDALIQTGQTDAARKVLEQGQRHGLQGEAVEALVIRLGGSSGQYPQAYYTSGQKMDKETPKTESNQPKRLAKKIICTGFKKPSPNEINTLVNLFNNRQYAKAANHARTMTVRYPLNRLGWDVLGAAFRQMGRSEDALMPLQRAAELSPGDTAVHNNLGIILQELGRLDEAVAIYRKVLQLKPNDAAVLNNLGLTLKELGRLNEAEVSYRRALEIQPDLSEAHSNLSIVLKDMGRLVDAEASCQRSLHIKPDMASAHYNMGNILQDQGRLDEAEVCYRHALTIKPKYPHALNNLGTTLSNLGKTDEAVECFRGALKYKPNWALPLFNLHSLVLKPDAMAAPIQCLEKAVEIDPSNATYKFFLGMLLDYTNNQKAVVYDFDKIERSTELYRALLDSWQYLKSVNIKLPLITGSNIQTFKLCIDSAAIDGLVMEFGVRFGASIRQIAALVDQEVHGFDSFEGLPEQWHHEPKGSYSTSGIIPNVPHNVNLYAGWFENTLPEFLRQHAGPVRLMNVDCDIYSSTKTVLEHLANRIIPGTVIIFDEYIGYEHWREDEFRAFQEAVVKYGWSYEYICFSFFTKQVAIRIV